MITVSKTFTLKAFFKASAVTVAGCEIRDGSSKIPETKRWTTRSKGFILIRDAFAGNRSGKSRGPRSYPSVLFYRHSVSIFSVPWLSLTYEYLSNSCLPGFPKNVVATHAQSYASNFLMNPVLNFRGWS